MDRAATGAGGFALIKVPAGIFIETGRKYPDVFGISAPTAVNSVFALYIVFKFNYYYFLPDTRMIWNNSSLLKGNVSE